MDGFQLWYGHIYMIYNFKQSGTELFWHADLLVPFQRLLTVGLQCLACLLHLELSSSLARTYFSSSQPTQYPLSSHSSPSRWQPAYQSSREFHEREMTSSAVMLSWSMAELPWLASLALSFQPSTQATLYFSCKLWDWTNIRDRLVWFFRGWFMSDR